MSLPSLMKDDECYVVRMVRFDGTENQLEGRILWPEVLVCQNEDEAHRVMDFLNNASFHDSYDLWQHEEPELTYEQAFKRWNKDDIAQYVVEHVPSLSAYPEVYRISESLICAGERFEDLHFN